MKKWIPWILVACFAAWIVGGMREPKPKSDFNIVEFGRLPVLLNGRIQPFDSVARNTLLSISGKSTVRLDGGKKMSAAEWMLEAMTRPEESATRKIFRTQHPDVESMLGTLGARLEYYSFNDVTNHLEEIDQQARKIMESEEARGEETSKQRTPFQKDLMHLYSSLVLYRRVQNSLQPEGAVDFQHELHVYKERIPAGLAALRASEQKEKFDETDLQTLSAFFKRYENVSRTAYPLVVPPLPDQSRDAWSNIGTTLMESMRSKEIHPGLTHLAAISTAYSKTNAADFNKAIADYRVWLQMNNLVSDLKKGREEYFFNQADLFTKAMAIYVLALLLGCIYWINLSPIVRRSAFALLLLGFVVHTVGLGLRMYLEHRPPVTNLYSSAIFVGWGAGILGIILERIYKNSIGLVTASAVGFITLIIAYHLSLSGDTMEMLRAVLDTNFWLATHVVCITTGYSSMFVAGLLATIYIVRGFFTRTLDGQTAKSLSRMVYGIVCFATLFSFVGTILGGIWADQSWGRFWGWDPKENGALLIVLWCAIWLHARWGGVAADVIYMMCRTVRLHRWYDRLGGIDSERALMAMAVFGNIVTSFSWFGVNMLGVGLHSYGFMDQAFYWLIAFIISQVALIVLCVLPKEMWRSFRGAGEVETNGHRPSIPSPSRGLV